MAAIKPGKSALLLFASMVLLAIIVVAAGQKSLILKSPGAFCSLPGLPPVRWYTLLLLVGYAAAVAMALAKARAWGYDVWLVARACLAVLIGGELGARLYYVAICFPYYVNHLAEIFDPRQTGLAIHGLIAGVSLALVLFCRVTRASLPRLLDLALMTVPLAQGIWRWGNFFNSEAFGKPISEPALIKLYIAPAFRPHELAGYRFFHAAFLYEAVWDFVAFLVLYFVLSERFRKKPGVVSCLFVVQYAVCRLIIEPIRVDGITWGSVNVPIVASLLSGAAGLWVLRYLLLKEPQESDSSK